LNEGAKDIEKKWDEERDERMNKRQRKECSPPKRNYRANETGDTGRWT